MQNLFTAVLLSTVVLGCISGAEKANSSSNESSVKMETSTIPIARVQEGWQKEFLNLVTKQSPEGATNIGLFSYGGWADQGQIFIVKDSTDGYTISFVNTGSREINASKSMNKDQFAKFFESVKPYEKLSDFDTNVMDGVQWEVVTATKKSDSVVVLKRLFMNNPGVQDQGLEHSKIIKSFLKLREDFGIK